MFACVINSVRLSSNCTPIYIISIASILAAGVCTKMKLQLIDPCSEYRSRLTVLYDLVAVVRSQDMLATQYSTQKYIVPVNGYIYRL